MYLQQYNNYWGSSNMWKYSNPNLTLSNPTSINFQTPVSGTINLTITNNTGSVINNTTTTTTNISIHQANNTYVQYSSSSGYRWVYSSGKTSLYFYVNAGQTYNIDVSAATTCNSGYTTGTIIPTSGNPIPLTDGFSVHSGTMSFTSPITGTYVVSYPNSSTGAPTITGTTTNTSYNLAIADSGDRDVYVDLGQSTLAVNETITVPITFTSSTDWFYFYYYGSVTAWPEVSFPYTGWSVRNPSDAPIHERSNGSWT